MYISTPKIEPNLINLISDTYTITKAYRKFIISSKYTFHCLLKYSCLTRGLSKLNIFAYSINKYS